MTGGAGPSERGLLPAVRPGTPRGRPRAVGAIDGTREGLDDRRMVHERPPLT